MDSAQTFGETVLLPKRSAQPLSLFINVQASWQMPINDGEQSRGFQDQMVQTVGLQNDRVSKGCSSSTWGGCARFLAPEYRRPLVAQEVLGYHADLVCLQEVDEKAFHNYFAPLMRHAGASPFPPGHVHDRMQPPHVWDLDLGAHKSAHG
jgi:hypothetical protein